MTNKWQNKFTNMCDLPRVSSTIEASNSLSLYDKCYCEKILLFIFKLSLKTRIFFSLKLVVHWTTAPTRGRLNTILLHTKMQEEKRQSYNYEHFMVSRKWECN